MQRALRSPADQSPTNMKLQFREGKITRFKDKRMTSASETESSETSEAATFTMPKDALTKPESVKYGIGCIICGELAATASQAGFLPQFAVCDNCKKAIIKLRKMLED